MANAAIPPPLDGKTEAQGDFASLLIITIIVNKRVRNAVLGCSLKNAKMISVCFQCKPFNIIVIPVYALTSNTEEAEVE